MNKAGLEIHGAFSPVALIFFPVLGETVKNTFWCNVNVLLVIQNISEKAVDSIPSFGNILTFLK